MTNPNATPDTQIRALWASVLEPLSKKQEMQKRYNQYMERNAHWLLGLDCFLIGVILTNALYQFLLSGLPEWPDLVISIGTIGLCATQAFAAFKSLKAARG